MVSRTDPVVLYTAHFGAYERKIRAHSPDPVRYPIYCYTDDPQSVPDGVVPLQAASPVSVTDARLQARWHKVLGAEVLPVGRPSLTVWLDANVEFVDEGALDRMVRWGLQRECRFATWAHPDRRTWRQEVAAVALRGGGSEDAARLAQRREYEARGYSKLGGLYSTCVLLRKSEDVAVRRLCDYWWNDIQTFTPRDQVSLPIAAAMAGLSISEFPWQFSDSSAVRRWVRRRRMAMSLASAVGLRGRNSPQHFHENEFIRVWRH